MGRYFAELINQYRTAFTDTVDVVTPYRYVRSRHLSDLDRSRYRTVRMPDRLLHGRGAVALRAANRFRFPRQPSVDVAHHTFYLPERLERGEARARVCTIYDMIPEQFPDPLMDAQAAGKRVYAEACHGFVCISETTRNDFLRIYGDRNKPMAVTPLAVSDVFVRPSATYVRLPQPYVLYVGRRGLYKNFRVLLQAFAGLSHRRRDLHLVCVGGGPFLDGERQHITSLGVERHVVRVDLDDAQLGAAYREATCFVFPSKIEGFGLPVLEALASGCPTLLADIPIFREIGADAALYFSPDDVGSLLDLLERASADRDLRRRLAADGQLRSRQFTWEQTARRSLRLYRTLLDGVQGAH